MATDDRKSKDAGSAKGESSSEVSAGGRRPGEVPPGATPLDIADLDLSIEVVEERISPGETNVFDK